MVTGSSEVAPVFAVAGIQKDSEERKDPAQAEERQLPGASPGEGQEGCLVGVLAVGHTQQARKRQASEAAWTCWRQPGCSADAVSPEQSGTQKRESSRIPPQKRVPAGVRAEGWLQQSL